MKWAMIVAFAIATVIASFALYAGIQHNSMGEFCAGGNLDVCEFDFAYAVILWLSWFIPAMLGLSLVTGLAIFIVRLFRRRKDYQTGSKA